MRISDWSSDVCSSDLLTQTQVFPALRYLDCTAPFTASSRSASSKTMNGALPPSSRDTFLIPGAHCSISLAPTSVEPVKEILRTLGLAVSSLPMSPAEPVTTQIGRAHV